MSTESPQQVEANYVRLMGAQTGESFAELMQDAARLHLKWNEFVRLYAVSPAQIDTLNKALRDSSTSFPKHGGTASSSTSFG